MNNTENVDNVKTAASSDSKAPTSRIPLGKAGWALLIYALLAAVGYCFLHPALFVGTGDYAYHMPGIGVTATQWTGIVCVLVCCRKQLRHSAGGWVCLICALALGLCFALYGNNVLRFLNLPLLIGSTFLGLYALTGHMTHSPLTAAGIREGLCRFFPGLFRHWRAPFKAITFNKKSQALQGLALGLAICVPVIALVLSLLSSADSVFGGMMTDFLHLFARIDAVFIWKLVKALALTLCIFSLWYALTQEKREIRATGECPRVPALTFTVVLGVLNIVYLLFVYVQLRYLFAGQETAAMAGYAHYARSGFFQLVWVSLITLILTLPALTLCPESKTLRIFAALSALLTLVILASALYRMRLYILVYGLSLLRLMTLWAITMIFLALLLTLCKCLRPRFKVCPALLTAALCSWAALNLLNADLTIARHNVRAYNQGHIQELDTSYLTLDLSPNTLPALYEIQDEALQEKALQEAANAWTDSMPAPYDTSLCYLRYGRAPLESAHFTLRIVNKTDFDLPEMRLSHGSQADTIQATQGAMHADGTPILPDEELVFTFLPQDFPNGKLPNSLYLTLHFSAEGKESSADHCLYFPAYGGERTLYLQSAEGQSYILEESTR